MVALLRRTIKFVAFKLLLNHMLMGNFMCHSKVFVKTEKFGKKANRKTFKLNFSSFTFIVSGKNVCPKILYVRQPTCS